ncbi:MAG: hypothetical protein ATN36_06160 [Epulopiscium sp. Nele67-Bin005]|nr:MAG: hypothetical protein ATN36_06160 [Epulopiscium sp. Nele67-Bin005]
MIDIKTTDIKKFIRKKLTKKNVIMLFSVAVACVILAYILTLRTITHVQVDGQKAVVTINFMTPINQEKFEEHLNVTPAFSAPHMIETNIFWINENSVQLVFEEFGDIEGQQVRVEINKAPSTWFGLNKSLTLDFNFKAPIEIVNPKPNPETKIEEVLIASDSSFEIEFNTPIMVSELQKYLECDAEFAITALNNNKLLNSHSVESATYFKLTPITQLENDRDYLITLKRGMHSESGVMLDEDEEILVKIAKEPLIAKTSPAHESKWIGLYPKITIYSDEPMVEAVLYVNDKVYKGELENDYRAVIYFDKVLDADTLYEAKAQITSPTGEKSRLTPLTFRTVPINEDRIWINITTSENRDVVRIYEGQKVIKEIESVVTGTQNEKPKGTFYVLEKGDSFYDHSLERGANSWIKLSEDIVIHGVWRDEDWEITTMLDWVVNENKGHIVVSEEEAVWIYENVPLDSLVIIHE